MIVLKKINNNVAVCRDNNQRELIAFGKGIGFPATPYELTDLKKIDRTFYNVNEQYFPLLNDIPYEVIQFVADQMLWVQDELPYETGANFVFTLADHIAFAMERAKKGVYIHMPSVYELELNYPREVKIGRKFVNAVRNTFKVKLPKNEVQGVAMHFINVQDYSQTDNAFGIEQHYEELLQKTTDMIEQELNIQVRKDTFNYARFATHMQYLLKRVFENKHIDSNNLSVYKSIQDEYPEMAECVNKICNYYKNDWELELSEEERLYLILHINRVCSKEAI